MSLRKQHHIEPSTQAVFRHAGARCLADVAGTAVLHFRGAVAHSPDTILNSANATPSSGKQRQLRTLSFHLTDPVLMGTLLPPLQSAQTRFNSLLMVELEFRPAVLAGKHGSEGLLLSSSSHSE